MSVFHVYKTITLMVCLALIASGCGSPAQSQSEISTAVAQTVQAQNSLTEIANLPTLTAVPSVEVPSTPESNITDTPSAPLANPGCTVSASLVSENPPDGAILKPGEYFWKTWTLLNTGTCTWNSSYQLTYWSGDLMDGAVSYPLPDSVAPNEQKDISIYLKAPQTPGTFTGFWKIKTPWGASFGAGLDNVVYVEVVVSSAKHPKFGITNVDFSIVREPQSGCVTNVYYTVYATISTNGPFDMTYYWNQSGSDETAPKGLSFAGAETKTISNTLGINHLSTKPTDYWMQLMIKDPDGYEYDKVYLHYNC